MPEAWTPDGFSEDILGIKLYTWQRDCLRDLMPIGSKVTLRAANESGKTSVVAAGAVMWHLALFPGCQVVCTSGVWRQITEQLWRHLKRYGQQLGWKVTQDTIETPQGSKALGFSTTEGGKFEGFHADDHLKTPLFIIVDEAKTVDPEIFQAIERCRPTRLLIQSSPGPPQGGFYDVCQDNRFKHHKITAFDCPHLGQAKADEVAVAYGKSSLLYASMIMAEWMVDPGQTFILTRRAIDKCLSTTIQRQIGLPIASIDVSHAEGGNENVLAVKYGNTIEIDDAFVGSGDANAIVDRLISRLYARRIRPEHVWIDADGMGAVYRNIFEAKGWNVQPWKGSEKAYDTNTFYNRSAEAYMSFARAVEQCQVNIPRDEVLFQQLCEKEYYINDKGKIQLQPKKDGVAWDRADAVVMIHSIHVGASMYIMEPLSKDEFWQPNKDRDLEWMLNNNIARGKYQDLTEVLPGGFNVGM